MVVRSCPAQVVLNGLNIRVPEAQLAREIGTHTGGTDYIGLIERVLDQLVLDCQYTRCTRRTIR